MRYSRTAAIALGLAIACTGVWISRYADAQPPPTLQIPPPGVPQGPPPGGSYIRMNSFAPGLETANLAFPVYPSSSHEIGKVLEEYRKTSDEDKRAKLKARLTDLLNKQFEAQEQQRNQEIQRLEEQMKKLRELMRRRSEARQSIVDKRAEQLVREAEGLGWTSPNPPGR